MRGFWMNNDRECAAYFRSRKAYERCMEELLKKWKSYGKTAGRITLKQTTEEERRAIGGIVGRAFYEETIHFSFSEFEKGLQKTRFAPVNMEKMLEAYAGKSLKTNRELQEEDQFRREKFLKTNQFYFREKAGADSLAFQWIEELLSSKKYGYSLLMREYGKDALQAEEIFRHTGRALIKLEEMETSGEELPLAVFAAELSDNPHYFDRGTAAGLLLVHAICFREKRGLPENTHEWRELLEDVGIVPDNISSQVHVCGLRLKKGESWHPAYEAFYENGEPCVVTMENLKDITEAKAIDNQVYVVENEMVFSYLTSSEKKKACTILCTSGQLRSAAVKLLDLLVKSGASVYYSGDTDPDGLGIADRLWQKFQASVHIWRMGPEDYEKSLSGEAVGRFGLAKLEQLKHPVLRETAEYIRREKKAGYQENLLEELAKDIQK